MSYQEQPREVPLYPAELQVLQTAIEGYLTFLRHGVQPSQDRNRMFQALHGVYMRLGKMLQEQHAEGVGLWLSTGEVGVIDIAVLPFCRLVPWVAEPSPERDETLQALEKIRVRISKPLIACNEAAEGGSNE